MQKIKSGYLEMSEIDDEPNLEEQIFHDNVRQQIIFLLLTILLYTLSYLLIKQFKRKGRDDYYSIDEDDITVYRISLWLCTFSLAVAIGAALLLPISILSNEILILYPNSYYVKWLNSSLIQSLWNNLFLFSNLSMFLLLPFSYLFTESEGFSGHKKGILSRVYETFVVFILLFFIVFGLAYVISACVDREKSTFFNLFDFGYYLPFLYSCISFFGALMLLICTPLGFVKLFDLLGNVLVKPKFLHNISDDYNVCLIEEYAIERKLTEAKEKRKFEFKNSTDIASVDNMTKLRLRSINNGYNESSLSSLEKQYEDIKNKRKSLEIQCSTSSVQRNLVYPLAIIFLIFLTGLTTFIVVENTIELLIGIKALPLSSRKFTLGIASLSLLGPIGAATEIVLILYLIVTSYIGLYTVPILRSIRPRLYNTPFTQIIGNCALILILSSALPLISKILGITNFDLLGDFGRIEWLGNFMIILLYNLFFFIVITLCLINKFTARVRRELYERLIETHIFG